MPALRQCDSQKGSRNVKKSSRFVCVHDSRIHACSGSGSAQQLHHPASSRVNQAGYGSTADPNFAQRPAAPMPVLTGYAAPPPPPVQPYTPNTGYIPFSETGYMIFTLDGFVSGARRINAGGYPGPGSTFKGAFKFNNTTSWILRSWLILTGVITTQRDDLPRHVRDYTFVMVSSDEVQLTALAHVPRPAVGTGTMKRIDASALADVWPFTLFANLYSTLVGGSSQVRPFFRFKLNTQAALWCSERKGVPTPYNYARLMDC